MGHYEVLVIGDSRLRGFDLFANDHSLNIDYSVYYFPGAQLHTLANEAVEILLRQKQFHLTIIAGGINNITKLNHNPSKHAVPRKGCIQDLVEYAIDEMKFAVQKVKCATDMPVVLASVAGIDLATYSPQYKDDFADLQIVIDRSIVEINHRIRGLNRSNSLPTLDFSSHIHRCLGKGGRYRTHYTHFKDGLHPTPELLAKWAAVLLKFCIRIFPEAKDTHDNL